MLAPKNRAANKFEGVMHPLLVSLFKVFINIHRLISRGIDSRQSPKRCPACAALLLFICLVI
jgi:hypothetical protein